MSIMKKAMDRIEKLMGLDSDIKNHMLDEQNVSKSGNESNNVGSNENLTMTMRLNLRKKTV